MNKKIYKITCLTNLHVGSGDANFDIVDKEVEKDPVTGYPIIHGSGIKGALLSAEKVCNSKDKEYIFGKEGNNDESTTAGNYKFLDAKMLARPLRVGEGSRAYILVTTVDAVNEFIRSAKSFDIAPWKDEDCLPALDFGNSNFIVGTNDCKNIEGETVEIIADDYAGKKLLEKLFGNNYALVKNMSDYRLPVIARNNLGKNRNLWYEEYVPHESVFWTAILYPEYDDSFKLCFDSVVQLGGNASIGCGYVKFDEMKQEERQ